MVAEHATRRHAWNAVSCSADGSKFVAVSPAGLIYTSADSGLTWTNNAVSTTEVQEWRAVASSADGNKLIAGSAANTRGAIFILERDARPTLTIEDTDGSAQISWIIPSNDFVIEQNVGLESPVWSEVKNRTNIE